LYYEEGKGECGGCDVVAALSGGGAFFGGAEEGSRSHGRAVVGIFGCCWAGFSSTVDYGYVLSMSLLVE